MTLEEFKDYFKTVCLKHVDIVAFYLGNDYNNAEDIRMQYPSVFLELPYYTNNYNLPELSMYELQFAFNVYFETNTDDISSDHLAMSKANIIGNDIIYYLINDSKIAITNVSGLSIREVTDDSIAGMRFELTIDLINDCTDIDEKFVDNEY